MRAFICLAVAALAWGCSREPDFDERYAAAEKQIRKTAGEIDTELARREKAAQSAAPAASSTPSGQPQSAGSRPADSR